MCVIISLCVYWTGIPMFSVCVMLRGLAFYHVDMGIHILWWDIGILAVQQLDLETQYLHKND